MASSIPSNITPNTVFALIPKFTNADPDLRFMALNDTYDTLMAGPPNFLVSDYNVGAKAIDGILKTLDDQNGEVQNLAIKCLTPLVNKISPELWCPLFERISVLKLENSVDRSIVSTALRTVVTALPRPIHGTPPTEQVMKSYHAVSKVLLVRLVGYIILPTGRKGMPEPPRGMLEWDEERGGFDSDALDLTTEVIRCFGPMLQEPEVGALQRIIMEILENDRTGSVVKKKAVAAYSVLAAYFNDATLSSSVSRLIESLKNCHLSPMNRRLLLTITGSMARSIPRRYGRYLQIIAPFIFSALSEEELQEQLESVAEDGEPNVELDEVREAALVALESFIASCSSEMRLYTKETIDSAIRFLKYDPNFADDGEDEAMEGQSDEDEDAYDGEEDFEEDDAFSDDDDMSWKVRRCAAKVLYTLISTRTNGDLLDDGTLYNSVAPVLVGRFKEREDNVRLEILSAISSLIRRTGEGQSTAFASSYQGGMGPPQGRKSRRTGSDASMLDVPSPVLTFSETDFPAVETTSSRAALKQLTPSMVRAAAKQLKGNSIPSKQAIISLLKDLLVTQKGGLGDYLTDIVGPVTEAVKGSNLTGSSTTTAGTGGSTSATAATLKIEALQLVATLAETHSSTVLRPYMPQIVSSLTVASQDKFYKISSEALSALEQYVKVLTPPRWLVSDNEQVKELGSIYDVLISRSTANEADLEVRQRAIHALGCLLARTSGPTGAKLISGPMRFAALDVLQVRLRNEITRTAAVRAIDAIAVLATDESEFKPEWVRQVALELGVQLRKANRSLRGSSLLALKDIIINPAGLANLDETTQKAIVDLLMPIIVGREIQLLTPALIILTKLAQTNPKAVVSSDLNSSLCLLVRESLSGSPLDALLLLVKTIGDKGVGQDLMASLLKDVGVDGDPNVVGKVIGTLLVHRGSGVGVRLEDFVKELASAQDGPRTCLALSVLGEAGLRLGSASPLEPQVFMAHFRSDAERVPIAAALALGRAGSGNVAKYLPVILKTMDSRGTQPYLFLHSIKEILQQASDSETNITAYSDQIWTKLLQNSMAEDNKAVGAECIGRLALIEPEKFLPALQNHLSDRDPAVRAMMTQAIRYSLADADESYDGVLRPLLVPILTAILHDPEVDNRRLALTTLNSATHNKLNILLPDLNKLMPLVMKESVIDKSLIREVKMGPFTHRVDDGLEVRKSAYETLYALMEKAFSRINVVDFYDRVLDGLADEHDIRILCNLMLTKLIGLDPEETDRRLDDIGTHFQKILSFKPKDTAVKQEVEKAEEASTGVLKVAHLLFSTFPSAASAASQHQKWRTFSDYARKDFGMQLRALDSEEQQRQST